MESEDSVTSLFLLEDSGEYLFLLEDFITEIAS